MKSSNKEQYYWNSYINNKAIVEFERHNNLSENKMNMNRYYLLSYFMDLYINTKKGNKITTKYIDGVKYIYVNSSFILNNLLLLKVEERTLVRIIEQLEYYGYIQRRVIKHVFRYIKINDELLQYCGVNSDEELRPKQLKYLAEEVGNYFGKTEDHQFSEVYEFLISLEDIEDFELQFNNYKEFKDHSNESIPRFKTFCEDWNQQNWRLLLEKLKNKEDINFLNSLHLNK